ncbi:IclR family transcriptional regulator [Pseudonocardia sp. CA-142604]|uniref:IclR family transcriptional regulator n=1 Tax=Pseudonocardia sp. CA-142604 TaxID=3240024 RepID=UPI003D94BC0A
MISKISAILLAISEGGGPTLTEIAARSDLPLSTVHRLVTELTAWRVLERDEEGRYRAGPPLRTFGGGCARREPDDAATAAVRVRDRAVPVIEDLFRATGSPVRVGFLDGPAVAYVEKVAGHLPVSSPSPAARLPVHATALGKVLLAFSSPRVADALLAQDLVRYTTATVTRPERLRWSFRTIRATRIAVCDRELDQDWCAVATPAFGAGGDVVVAVELRVRDLARDVPTLRAPLVMSAGWLSRELAQCIPARPAPAERGSA